MSSDEGDTACIACDEPLPKNDALMCCAECEFSFHLGACSGVSKSAFKKKSTASKETWTCLTCKKAKARSDPVGEDPKSSNEKDDGNTLAEISRKLSVLMTLHAKVDTLIEMKNTVDGIERSVQVMSDQYDELLTEVKQQKKEISDLKKRIERVETSGDAEVQQLRREVNELEQYSRRQNIEVHGLVPSANENLLSQLNALSEQLQLPKLTEQDFEAAHRLPPKPDKVPVILVRFASRLTRDKWLQGNTRLRQMKSTVRIYENLTAQNKKLFWQIKTKAAGKGYQFAWHKAGKMFVRKAAGDRLIRIAHEDDLELIR